MSRKEARPTDAIPGRWVERTIWVLYGWCLAATILSIPGVIAVAVLLPRVTVRLVARSALGAAVLTDLISVYLDVTYLLHGGGRHAEAFVWALCYYVVFVAFGIDAAWWWRLAALAALAALSVSCQLYLPQAVARRLGWRPAR
ncbi:MAG: hypothetical protein ACE149_19485 [Armatimonadota bacterium]